MNSSATHPTVTCNLTGKLSTSPQIDAWVGDLNQEERDTVTALLTAFEAPPTPTEIRLRAGRLAQVALGWVQRMDLPPETPVLIEGPDFLIPALARRIISVGLKPVFAVYERDTLTTLEDADTIRFVEYTE